MSARIRRSSIVALVGAMAAAFCGGCGGTVLQAGAEGGPSKDSPGDASEMNALADAGRHADAEVAGPDANALGACLAPAWTDAFDGSYPTYGQCIVARYVVACEFRAADSALLGSDVCLGNDETAGCPNGFTAPSGATVACKDQCEPNEYGFQCGDLPAPVDPSTGAHPQPPPPPPAHCHEIGHATEDALWCCPCGS
jgi:hypothetical protein